MNKKKYIITTVVTALFFLTLSVFAWIKPADDFSLSERRSLSQFPEISFNTVISGDFMKSFEKYTLDQFPLRDNFRTIKALISLNIFNDKISKIPLKSITILTFLRKFFKI